MYRAVLGFLTCALLLGLALPVAWAGGRVAGEGYTLSVPPRFILLPPHERAHPATQLPLTEGLTVTGAPDLRVFHVGRPAHPQAVFVVTRIEMANANQLRSRLDLQRYLLDHVRQSEVELDALVSKGEVKLTPTRIAEYDGLLMQHDGSPGALGLIGEPAVRALVVRGEDFIMVLALMVMDEAQVPIETNWQQLVRSLVIDPRGAFLRSMFLYGGIALAALVFLVFVLRLRAQRRRARGPRGLPPPRIHVTSEDDLAAPGLGDAGEAPAAAEPAPEPAEAAPAVAPPLPPMAAPRERVAAPAGLTQSLGKHRAEHPEAPVAPQAAPLVAEEDDVVDLPDAQAGPEHETLPHSELERPIDAPAPPPARKGLKRTRPQSGRFSE